MRAEGGVQPGSPSRVLLETEDRGLSLRGCPEEKWQGSCYLCGILVEFTGAEKGELSLE